jgi:hypothetical protein
MSLAEKCKNDPKANQTKKKILKKKRRRRRNI